jgi:hypothetical protein
VLTAGEIKHALIPAVEKSKSRKPEYLGIFWVNIH